MNYTIGIPDIEENLHNGLHVITKQKQENTPKERSNRMKEEYKPDQIPPNFNQAHEHHKANLVGQEIETNDENNVCICCARQIEKQKINLNCNLKEISFLGSGYPLYFSFLKYCEIFLSLILVFSGGFNMLTNVIYGTDCVDATNSNESDQNICKKNWITMLSLGNKQKQSKLMFIQEILNLVTIFIVIGLLQIFRRYQRKLDIECDEADISANDYTLLFEDIPIEFDAINNDYDDDLKFFIETSVKQKVFSLKTNPNQSSSSTQEIEVVKINLCYNLKEQQELIVKHNKLIKRKQKIMKQTQKGKIADSSIINQVNARINDVDAQLMQFQEKFLDGKGTEFMKQYFVGKALVSFKTEKMKEDVLDVYQDKKLSKELLFHEKVLKAIQAPYPTDVYWENLHIPESEKTKRFIKGFGITVLALCACAASIYLLIWVQNSQQDNSSTSTSGNKSSDTLVQAIAILLSIAITLLNIILSQILRYLTNLEGCYTRTEYNISIAKKMTWATFINTALIQFLIQVVFSTKSKFGVIFSEGGLAYNQNYVFISNMAIPFIMESLDIPAFLKKLQIKYFLKKKQKCFMTQSQLNSLFESPQYNISQQYAVNLKTMFIVAFYSPILPIGIVYSMIAIFLIYWVDKYNILRRKTIKFSQSAELSIEMTEMIEYILPIYSLSNTLFFIYIVGSEDVSALSWIGLAIGLIHSALPMQEWNEKLFKIPEAIPNVLDYQKAEKIFSTDYERENPATQMITRKKYLERGSKIEIEQREQQNAQMHQNHQDQSELLNKKNNMEVQDLDDYGVDMKNAKVNAAIVETKLNMSYQDEANSSHKMSNIYIKTPTKNHINSKQETADTAKKETNFNSIPSNKAH